MTATRRRNISIALWTAQIALAAIFLFAGIFKLVIPADDLTKDTELPAAFLRFIGICEVFGALGLLLPGISGIRPQLTPIAASCLVVIMIGAVVVSVIELGAGAAIVPFVVGIVAATVAWTRFRVVPIDERPSMFARPIGGPSGVAR